MCSFYNFFYSSWLNIFPHIQSELIKSSLAKPQRHKGAKNFTNVIPAPLVNPQTIEGEINKIFV
jgi:hypothetical protein